MKDLTKLYAEWRKTGEEQTKGTDLNFTWDCGEASAREDFSYFADLGEVISYRDMLELENNY